MEQARGHVVGLLGVCVFAVRNGCCESFYNML